LLKCYVPRQLNSITVQCVQGNKLLDAQKQKNIKHIHY